MECLHCGTDLVKVKDVLVLGNDLDLAWMGGMRDREWRFTGLRCGNCGKRGVGEYVPTIVLYAPGVMPDSYKCKVCGKTGVKLWRPYQSFCVKLQCVDCAEKAEKKKLDLKNGDQIGWLIPAVPCVGEPDTYWGYTSVPPDGVQWWKDLPLRK